MPRRRSVSMNSMRSVRCRRPCAHRIHPLRQNSPASLVRNGWSVRSRRSGVTAMRLSASAARSVPSSPGWLHAALEGDPVVRIAAAVVARLDVQQLLVALALGGDRDALHLAGRAVGEVDVDQHVARDAGLRARLRMMPGACSSAVSQFGVLPVAAGIAPATARSTGCRARSPPSRRRWCRNRCTSSATFWPRLTPDSTRSGIVRA